MTSLRLNQSASTLLRPAYKARAFTSSFTCDFYPEECNTKSFGHYYVVFVCIHIQYVVDLRPMRLTTDQLYDHDHNRLQSPRRQPLSHDDRPLGNRHDLPLPTTWQVHVVLIAPWTVSVFEGYSPCESSAGRTSFSMERSREVR